MYATILLGGFDRPKLLGVSPTRLGAMRLLKKSKLFLGCRWRWRAAGTPRGEYFHAAVGEGVIVVSIGEGMSTSSLPSFLSWPTPFVWPRGTVYEIARWFSGELGIPAGAIDHKGIAYALVERNVNYTYTTSQLVGEETLARLEQEGRDEN